MGLTILLVCIGLMISLIIILSNTNISSDSQVGIGFLIVILIAITITIGTNIAMQDPHMQYEANVTINNNPNTPIRFNDFSQNSSNIYIEQYVIGATHWFDYKGYNVINTPLIISLKDNDNKFVYKDIKLNKIFNQNGNATQP